MSGAKHELGPNSRQDAMQNDPFEELLLDLV
jgi:hypothetical protein